MKYSKVKLKNISDDIMQIKEIKETLLNLAVKSNDEINKNRILKQLIEFNKNELNRNKECLSLLSSLNKISHLNIKKLVKNELIKNNKYLLDSKELLKNKIEVLKRQYEINSFVLERNIKQQKNVLEALKEELAKYEGKPVVIEGYPRNIEQAKKFEEKVT